MVITEVRRTGKSTAEVLIAMGKAILNKNTYIPINDPTLNKRVNLTQVSSIIEDIGFEGFVIEYRDRDACICVKCTHDSTIYVTDCGKLLKEV